MTYDYNPNRLATDREGIITIIEDGRLDTVIITCMLVAEGRSALEKFLKNYVVDRYGMDKFVEWSDRAEKLLRRTSALKTTPVLIAPSNETTTGQEEGMLFKFHYFAWWVEPKDKTVKVHPHDRQAQKRIIEAQTAERERQQKEKEPYGGSYFTKKSN